MYPGLTYVGTRKFSGLYGCNETIVDQKAIGLQHLFVEDYQTDLIHTACSVVTIDDRAYFGDRIKPKRGHSLRQASEISAVKAHCIFEDVFKYDDFTKTDRVTALEEDYLYFETEIYNHCDHIMNVKLSALCITQGYEKNQASIIGDNIIFSIQDKFLLMRGESANQLIVSKDAPSGFMYKGIEDIIYDNIADRNTIVSDSPIAGSASEKITLAPNERAIFRWVIIVGKDEKDCLEKSDSFSFLNALERSKSEWQGWLGRDYRERSADALVALKAANLNGFIPADLTGHYFANNHVCFYVRDALMGSRAFLYSGHYEEFKEIIEYLLSCPVKSNGEFYQRYNPKRLPDEGANNNVFSQIDTIGYFTRAIADYDHLTGEQLVDFSYLEQLIDVFNTISTKNDLFGPEGGVNEGVYGPAYITSTNMFIAAGILGVAEMAKRYGRFDLLDKWSTLANKIINACERCFIEEGYYAYGYVSYHDDLVLRYDTPQLLAASLGYPISNRFKKSFEYLTQYGTYFGLGYGYSEQEYHNGPWLFNTAGAAQVAYLTRERLLYDQIMDWMNKHKNAYGLLPEAVDARDEGKCFINPLMWANAEYVCCDYMDIIAACRGGVK